jgi:hypothetical protein
MEQALYLRAGCDDSETRPASMPRMAGHKTGLRAYTERYQMGADNKGRDIKSNQVRASNRPVRTVQAIRMRIARDAAVAHQRMRGRRGYGDEGEEGVDRDGGE